MATCNFPLTNTGEAGEGIFDSDIYRLSARSRANSWEVTLPNALAFAKAGETIEVPVHAVWSPGGKKQTVVTLTATSETDPEQSTKRLCSVKLKDTRP
jgi:hypothetical protein